MAESLLEKAKRLNIQPTGETLLQKAQRLGIQPASQIKEPNYFQRVGQSFQREAEAITTGVQKGAEAITDLSRSPISRTGELLRTGLETAGGVARGAFAPILEAPILKQAIGFVTGKLIQVPQVEKVISTASELAKKYPKQARDIQNIVDITSLGYAPKVSGVISKEAKAIGFDIAQGTRVVLNSSEEAVQADIVNLFQKSIKPTAKKTLAQGQRYENDVLNALKTIKANADNLNVEDVTGELVSRTPQTLNELSQSLDQTKRLVFNQYDELAKQAGTGGAVVDARPIADELVQVAQNKALQITNPELIKYAETWAERLRGFGQIDTQTAQEVVKNLNNSLTAFYKNPTYESATKVAIDAGIVNNFRKALDDAIEGATGLEYQALKNQYASLKAIENDVVRASMRDARKNAKGLLDYTDIFTSGQMIGGILSLNPAMFTKGAIERGFKEYFKFLNDPNRAVGNMFDLLDTSTVKPFVPTSATFNYLKNPKLGMGIEDVSKDLQPLAQEAKVGKFMKNPTKAEYEAQLRKVSQGQPDSWYKWQTENAFKQKTTVSKSLEPLASEARKYKSAEEFVKNTYLHGTGELQANKIMTQGFDSSLKGKLANYKGITGNAIFTTKDLSLATDYAGFSEKGKIGILQVSPDVIIKKVSSFEEAKNLLNNNTKGFDILEFPEKSGDITHAIVNPKVIIDKTFFDRTFTPGQVSKSQLIDFYNKVTKKK